MSTALDETALLATFKALIDDYGRNVVFYKIDRTTAYTAVKITPPTESILISDNVPRTVRIGVVSASGLGFTPFQGQRVVDESSSYYVTEIVPLSSGDTLQAYKITYQR